MADAHTPEQGPDREALEGAADGLDLSPRTNVDGTAVGQRRKRNVLPIVVLAMVFVAGGVIVTQFLTSAVDYYCNVDEVGVRDGCDGDRRIRLQGTVDEGSVVDEAGTTFFTISFNGETLPVRYDGAPGGIFKECIPVVVHGVIENDALLGDRIEVKHSDEYVSVNDERVADAEDLGCEAATI
jgi:cytochrome c-type biogenesis protein CcmE